MNEGYPVLDESALDQVIAESMAQIPLTDKRMLVIVPDLTRTMPLPLFFRLIVRHVRQRCRAVTFLIALGTHPPLSDDAINRLFGMTPQERADEFADINFINHAWNTPSALLTLGTIPASEVAALSNGLLQLDIPVRINRLVMDYDHILICGPVFPHEVAGFSGGNKYLFPGVSGPDVIDATHWLGALITSHHIIGTKMTPVRQVIDRAATLIPRPKHALCCVVSSAGVHGVFFGTPESAFEEAADLSAQIHIHIAPHAYRCVLSLLPEMYDDIWVGAKGMYKLEPVVMDGGEVIIYAPHITELSRTHGDLIRRVGYHVRDYFLAQWKQFQDLPWGILAHSTHLKGAGTYEQGIEHPRIQVTLATAISEAVCREVSLGYRDPSGIDPHLWMNMQNDDTLVVPHAGETLYKLGA